VGITVAVPEADGETLVVGEPDEPGLDVAGVEGLALRRTTTTRPHIPQFGYFALLPWIRQ
jgi:hypothetical protein